jgi:hypothetical protein
MKLKDIKEVLNFAAFRPEPDDGGAQWQKRFPKQRSLLLSIGRNKVSWVGVEKNGTLGETGELTGEIKDIAQDMAEEWKSMTEGGWCSVALNNRFMISLETNLTRKKGSEILIRTNPKAALGSKAEKGKRYAVEHNQQSNSSVLLSVDEEFVKSVEAALNPVGLNIARVACAPFVMLQDGIDQVTAAREQFKVSNAGQSLGKMILVVCCDGSFSALTQNEDQWSELRSRSGLYTPDNLEPVSKILQPLVDHAGANAQIIFMADEVGTGLSEYLQSALPNIRISDVTQPSQMWNILKQN